MLYVPDKSGRFLLRPLYRSTELDSNSERIVTEYVRDTHRNLDFPLSTEILTSLVERVAGDLDLYSDLSEEGPNVHGVTYFFAGAKPVVRIAKELSIKEHREHRLRTTLSHEFGHIACHRVLFDDSPLSPVDPAHNTTDGPLRCHQANGEQLPKDDWMEWQANYFMGGVLMPRSHLRRFVRTVEPAVSSRGPMEGDTDSAFALVSRVAEYFDVSRAAARIRLLDFGYIVKIAPGWRGTQRGT